MHKRWIISIAAPLLITMTGPALAQDQGPAIQSYFQMFFLSKDLLGQLLIIVLVLMSVFAIAFVIKLFLDHRRQNHTPQALYDQVTQMIADKKYREAIDTSAGESSYLGKLIHGALSEATGGYGAMERMIEEVADAETTRMLRPIEYLNVIGNISPMMGLFGTVYGMIVAFQSLVEAAGRPEPQELAAGISTALVTTFWGLIVAMPALAGYALIRNKVDAITSEGIVMAEELIRPFKAGGKRGDDAAGPAAERPRATPKPEG